MPTFYSRISFLRRWTPSRKQQLGRFAGEHLVVDRRGSPRALRLWPPSPAVRPADRGGHTLEVHRGGARASRPFSAGNGSFFSYKMRERSGIKAYSPTTCLAAGAERGVCILWNITGDSSRSALLQCCPAPTGAAVSVPITGGRGVSGVWSCDFSPSVSPLTEYE